MKVLSSILGLIIGAVIAVLSYEPIYDIIWPGATDKHEGGPGFFLFFMLGPIFMILGAIVGAILYGHFSKAR
ncbi:MAG: hypothetical protein ACLQAH_03795 [Limisphaerales bacterium]